MRLDEQFIRKIIPDVSFDYLKLPEHISLAIDSRTLEQGDFFLPLAGQNSDGHLHIADALRNGARGVFVAHDKKHLVDQIDTALLQKISLIVVPDTHQALLRLAQAWRQQFTIPVIGVTGSVGKTTTKEMLANIVALNGQKYIASEGNQNTAIGLALNILKITDEHEIAIFEMGISKRGEMTKLTAIAQPTTAIITTIGHAHMEGLGSVNDISAEKREIFSLFKEDNIGIINGDQAVLSAVSYIHPVIKFGVKTTNQIQARKINNDTASTTFVLKIYGKKYSVNLRGNHAGLVMNALAATAMAYNLNIPVETIIKGIQQPVCVSGRFEERPLKLIPGTVINDCYNASPESMKAALLAFEHYDTAGQKIAVLGDMLELGVNSPFWHRQLGRFLRKVPTLKRVVLVGSHVAWTKKTLPVGLLVDHVADWQEAQQALSHHLSQESIVLIKGSRALGLDNLVNEIS